MKTRCAWANNDPQLREYHDREWGVPVYDDRLLFEFLVLEGAQAGLSWSTILKKRDNYRKTFDDFDPLKVARYEAEKIEALLSDPGIVRNRLKVVAAVENARALVKVQEEFGSFDSFIWRFEEGVPKQNHWKLMREIPGSSSESEKMSKELIKRGFRFVGPTICYAFMQATGMVNDHTVDCYRHTELES